MIIEIVVIAGLILFIAVLLSLIRIQSRHMEPAQKKELTRKNCPLCGEALAQGERVHSIVYQSKTKDNLVEVYGCPHCYPVNSVNIRMCPVCKKKLAPRGYLIGRMFSGQGKKHLHINGCTGCRHIN